MKKSWISGC